MMVIVFYFAALVAVLYLVAKIAPTRDSSSPEYKPSDGTPKEKTLKRLMEPTEDCLEELHQLGAGNVATVLRLCSKISLSTDHVNEALEHLLRKHPLLRVAIAREACDSSSKRFFQEVCVDVTKVLTRNEKSANHWKQVFEESCGVVFDTTTGPLWSATWLQECFDYNSNTYNNTFIFICHHAIVDGTSALNIAKHFTDSLNFIAEGNDEFDYNSYPLTPGLHTLLARDLDWKTWQKCLMIPSILKLCLRLFLPLQARFSSQDLFLSNFPPVSLKFPEVESRTRVILMRFSEEEVGQLVNCARQNNSTVSGALSVACHIALVKMVQDGDQLGKEIDIAWKCAVNCRRTIESGLNENYLGCFVSAFYHKLKVSSNQENFWKLAAKTSAEIKNSVTKGEHLKFLWIGPLIEAKDAAKATLFTELHLKSGTSEVCNTISNIGRYDWPECSDITYRVDEAFFLSSTHLLKSTFNHFITTTRGKLFWAACYNSHVVMETTAERYLEETRNILIDAIC
nr:AT2 [Erythropodium caribaeorum]